MDEFLKELEKFGDLTGTFTLMDFTLVLFLSFALSLIVAAGYRYTHRGVSYSQSFVHTLVIMGTVVSLIMLVIGSNIARAFALVGALSIIGVPPTCGFFSKWYLISGSIQAGHYGFMVALLFSSLVNVVLFFRVIEITS